MAPQAGDDSRLDDLLLRWEELREQGQSLSAEELCSTCPELAGELGRRIELLRRFDPIGGGTTSTEGEKAPPATAAPPAPDSAMARAEFRDLRFHAAGALGEVFTATNAELNREVALKFLKPERVRDAESRRRFLQEAEVTGRLEHPGVVPIYALGMAPSGAPCYAMRFIRGATLQDAIDAFHAAERPGRDPSERSLAWRSLLERFVSICGTMAYAHSRGILHRDLKPRNVMLGKYDETLVVDWGLAKPFDRGGVVGEVGEETLTPSSGSGEGGSETPTVGVVGTPAYMSPEQAEARWDIVGPASDLFGLGGILYAILTGRAPYQGRTIGEVLEKVRRCEFPPPREVKPGVPRALEAVCLKAMARRPEDRYESAAGLAADVRRWLADEPVSAYREPMAARARRWVRRHRTLMAGAAAALVVGLAGLAAFAAALSGKNRELDAKNAMLAEANGRLERSNAELAAATARESRARADSDRRLDETLRAIEEYYTGVGEEVLLGQAEFRPLRARLLERPRQFYAQLARELGAAGPHDPRARRLLARGRYGLARIQSLLGAFADARAELEAAIRLHLERPGGGPDADEDRAGLARCYSQLGAVRASTGDYRGAAESEREAIAIEADLVARHPDVPDYRRDLEISHANLGTDLRAVGDIKGAVASYERAIADAGRLTTDHPQVREYQRGLAAAYSNLGSLQGYLHDLTAAGRSQREAIAIYSRLAATPPVDPRDRNGLAMSYSRLGLVRTTAGDTRGAAESFGQAVKIAGALVDDQPNVPDYRNRLAAYYTNLGYEQRSQGDLGAAAESYRQAVAIGRRLVADYPGDPEYRQGLVGACRELGILMASRADPGGAAASLREAIAIATGLVAAHPDVPQYQNSLAESHGSLGLLLQNTGDLPGALAAHRQAEAVLAKLVASQPGVPRYRFTLVQTLGNLGLTLARAGDLKAAADAFRRVIGLQRALMAAHPDVPQYRESLTLAYQSLGEVQHLGRDPAGAEASYREAIAIQSRLLDATPDKPDLRYAVGLSMMNLGLARAALGRHPEAEASLREAIDHQRRAVGRAPGVAHFRQALYKSHGELARFLIDRGRAEEAIGVMLRLRESAGDHPGALYDVACALALLVPDARAAGADRRLASEAVGALRAAIAAGWSDAAHAARDPDLAALRDRDGDDFRRLLAAMLDRGFPADPFAR